MSDTNYLLDAFTKLAKPHKTRVMQANAAGISCISEVEHDPLLVQLRDAVVGGIGSHSGSSPARERIPFDAGALELFDSIVKQINAWHRELPNGREDRHIHDRLSDWYISYANKLRAGKITEGAERDTLKLLEGWVRSIEAKFDPPQTVEISDVCPICYGRYAIDPKTGDRITALVMEYRELGPDTLDAVSGLCRSCDMVWHGVYGMRAMHWAIAHPEEPAENTPPTVQGYTLAQITKGLDSAVSVRNMKGAASLLGMLATVDPTTAAEKRITIAKVIADDKADAERRSARRKEVA